MHKYNFDNVSNEDLLARLRNSEIAVESKPKFAEEAAILIKAIHEEWNTRARKNDFEPEPVTTKNFSLLEWLGYHVGEKNGLKREARERKLSWVFENPLPPIGSPEDYFEWGQPKTQQRYEALKRKLKGRNQNYGKSSHVRARKETDEDLEFIDTLKWEK